MPMPPCVCVARVVVRLDGFGLVFVFYSFFFSIFLCTPHWKRELLKSSRLWLTTSGGNFIALSRFIKSGETFVNALLLKMGSVFILYGCTVT